MSNQNIPSDNNSGFDIVIPSLIAANSKQAVRAAAQEMSKVIGIGERILTDRLMEKDSATAMGDGIAISHLRMSGLRKTLQVFIRLKTPVCMNAPDNRDVDLFCLVLTPEREGNAYLRTLARISRLLRNPHLCARLRAAPDERAIRALLEQSAQVSRAA